MFSKYPLPQPEDWIEKLSQVKAIRETALFGAALHAVTENADLAASAAKELFAKEAIADYSDQQRSSRLWRTSLSRLSNPTMRQGGSNESDSE